MKTILGVILIIIVFIAGRDFFRALFDLLF